jgi:hypothetical protein
MAAIQKFGALGKNITLWVQQDCFPFIWLSYYFGTIK